MTKEEEQEQELTFIKHHKLDTVEFAEFYGRQIRLPTDLILALILLMRKFRLTTVK